MPLEELQIEFPPIAPPQAVKNFLAEADRRIDRFFDQNRNRRLPRYIPCDPLLVYSALHYIAKNDLALGNRFCEWGSGFGVCAGLAYHLGFQPYAIEIEPELHALAEALASDLDIQAQFFNASYLPEGFESYEEQGGHRLMTPPGHERRRATLNYSLRYEEMDLEIEDIDLFYVYPWPEEQELLLELFDAVAAEDVLLLAYFAPDDLHLYRKTLG